MKKLVIIPAYNEANNLNKVFMNLRECVPDYDYVVINDCSNDSTGVYCRLNNISCIDLPVNLGIGGAVQTGYQYAAQNGYDLAVQFDGDGQHKAEYIHKLEEKLKRDNADMVIGSRFIEHEGFQSSGMRRVGIRYFEGLLQCLYGVRITDATSGFRMCNRQIIERFASSYPQDYPEPETTAELLRDGFQIKETAVQMERRAEGKSSISHLKSVYYMIKVSLAIILTKAEGKAV